MNGPCALVLAAGYGRRFGEQAGEGTNKLLAPCVGLDGSRRALLEQALVNFGRWRGERLLVVRQGSDRLAELGALGARHGFECLIVASAGMGDSLSAAVRATPNASGWLVALGDMPWVRPETLLQVAARITADQACVPVYQGRRGHPVGFGRGYAGGLAALQGDQGGRRLLEQGQVTLLEVDDPGVLQDVDVPGDLAQRLNHLPNP